MSPKVDTFVKLALIFFISLLSFAMGTYVGKKYSDAHYKEAMLEGGSSAGKHATTAKHGGDARTATTAGHEGAAHEPAAHGEKATAHGDGRDVASIPKGHGAGHSEDKNEIMSDEEIAKLAEEMSSGAVGTRKIETHGSQPAALDRGGSKGHNDKNSLHDDHNSFSKNQQKGKKPSSEKPLDVAVKMLGKEPANHGETREPTSLPINFSQYSHGKYTVQVAAFASKSEAEGRVTGLKNQGFEAFFIPAQVKGRTWYRVNVGLFASENEAKNYRKDFLIKSKSNDAIVQKISE